MITVSIFFVFLHLKAVVAKALGSTLNHVNSRSLAVPVPLVDLCGAHVQETGHLSDLQR